MPIESNASNKQVNVGKMPIKGGLPWQSPMDHLLLSPVTLISQWRIKNTKQITLNLNLGVLKNQDAGGRGGTKGKKQPGNSKQATRAKLCGNGLNLHVQRDHVLVNYDYL